MASKFAKPFYNSKLWKQTRENILKRDNYLCVVCGQPASDVHHIIELTPKNIDDVSISINPDNLQSLCKDCHNAQHTNKINDCSDGFEFDPFGNLVRCKRDTNVK